MITALAIAFALVVTKAMATVAQSTPNLPTEKQALEDRIQLDRAKGIQNWGPERHATEIAYAAQVAINLQTRQPTPVLITGIRDVQLNPFRAEDATVENQWQGWVNGQLVRVYAGKLTKDPAQGFVAVETNDLVATTSLPQMTPQAGLTSLPVNEKASMPIQKYLTPARLVL